MSRRNTEAWEVTLTVLSLIAAALLGVGLFAGLAEHPTVAALWALFSTAGMVWLGYMYLTYRHAERLRAVADRERRAVEPPIDRRTVSDVILGHRLGRRIGDAERDVIVGALHTHFAAGRLNAPELDERIAAALAARTVDDLCRAVHDLPSEVTGR